MRKLKLMRRCLLPVAFIATIIALSFWLAFVVRVDAEKARRFIASFGVWGPVAFISLYVLQQVFAPLAGTPFLLAGFTLFGTRATFIFVYLSDLIGAAANFWIARVWGRPLVRRLSGERATRKIDEIADLAGVEALVTFRLFGGGSFDYVSYAYGLADMGFRPYLLITALCLLPHLVLFFTVFRDVLTFSSPHAFLILVLLYLYSISIPRNCL